MPAKKRRPELEEVQGQFKFPIRLPPGPRGDGGGGGQARGQGAFGGLKRRKPADEFLLCLLSFCRPEKRQK